MDSGARIAIRIGFIALFFVIRQIYKSSSGSGVKEFSISSTLTVESGLIDSLQLKSGEQVSLLNRPDSFEVVVRAKGITDRFEDIGVIEDRELAEKVRSNVARGTIEYVDGNNVKIKLIY